MPHPVYGKIGLLLNGGGARCLIQAGEIQAFVDHGLKQGIEYDTIYGSSGGALNGVKLHQKQYSEMKQMWMTLKSKDVYNWNWWQAYLPFTSMSCMYDSTPLSELIDKHLDVDLIYENPKDFVISATDFSQWQPVFEECKSLSPDDLHAMLFASASPPIYFPNVNWKGRRLCDAGLMANYNIQQAVADGCDTLILMGFARPKPRPTRNVLDSVGETLSIAMYGYFQKECGFVEKINSIVAEAPAGVLKERTIKLVKIIPDNDFNIGFLDFDYKGIDREQAWQSGYDLSKRVLESELSCAPT